MSPLSRFHQKPKQPQPAPVHAFPLPTTVDVAAQAAFPKRQISGSKAPSRGTGVPPKDKGRGTAQDLQRLPSVSSPDTLLLLSKPIPVGGRLQPFFRTWELLNSIHTPPPEDLSSFIPASLRPLPFKDTTQGSIRSVLKERNRADPTRGSRLPQQNLFCRIFLVRKKPKGLLQPRGWRPIIDLNRLDKFLKIRHFQM